jgi:hypothetical protein
MRRAVLPLVGLGCLLVLLLVCYRAVLFEDGQFVSANASYYYPLDLRVRQEWGAGRWPLWDPGHNGGEPLLGNPIAAVLYPGKVLYAWLPYAWAARLYVIAHTTLAFVGMLVLGRSLGVSGVGSCLGGLSYAFGAPALLLYSNTIHLVGAAWIPWGLCAIDRLLRVRAGSGDPRTARRGVAGLAAVLAMQMLGGDPEQAYLTAGCGAGYAVVLAVRGREDPSWLRTKSGVLVLGALGLWVATTLGLAALRIVGPGLAAANGLVLTAWVALALGLAWHWRRHPREAQLAPLLARLAAACGLAMALAAVQVLPVLEFIGQSWRAGGIHAANRYRYSLDPVRVAELAWPNPFGISAPENRSWLQAIPPVGSHEVYVDSLYMGGVALVLALGAAGWGGGPPWRAWLTTVAVVGLATSLGKYGGPLWWARWGPWASIVGPHDPSLGQPRQDDLLPDGSGSPYGLLALLLPGFGAFRYPAKLATFAAVGLAVLVGAGWDRAARGETRRLRRLSWAGLGASLVGLVAVLAGGGRAIADLAGRAPADPLFGPADGAGAWAETERALAHGAIVFAAVLALAHWAPRHPRAAAALALLLLAADLAVANARLIRTAPQAVFDAPSETARRIEAAERADPAPGPFRIHRMPGGWFPIQLATTHTPQRDRELIAWARETLYPLFALPLGLEYCTTIGSLELDDYVAFFHPQLMPIPAGMARVLGVPAGQPVVYFPRRSFDLWGARYFLLPARPDWQSRERGFASLLDQTELIYPGPDLLQEQQDREGREPWAVRRDWQLLRNRAAYPRAWLVHHARLRPPSADPEARARLLRTMLFMNDPIWRQRDGTVLDLRQVALIETDDPERLRGFLAPTPVGPAESVAVVRYEPQRVELRARLDRPGLVILADTFYPGWHLTIDGRPAPILRANRVMRGAAVPAGEYTLVYTYQPLSFRVGAIVSAAGWIALMMLAWSSWRKPPATPERSRSRDEEVVPGNDQGPTG